MGVDIRYISSYNSMPDSVELARRNAVAPDSVQVARSNVEQKVLNAEQSGSPLKIRYPGQNTFGLPPINQFSDNLTAALAANSFVYAKITPLRAQVATTKEFWKVSNAEGQFVSDLKTAVGETLDRLGVKIPNPPYFFAINSNGLQYQTHHEFVPNYWEQMVKNLADVYGPLTRLLVSNLTALDANTRRAQIEAFLSKLPEMSYIRMLANKLASNITKFAADSKAVNSIIEDLTKMYLRVVMGRRVEMPDQWHNSGGNITFPLTVKLVCGNPSDDQDFGYNILLPWAILLAFGAAYNEAPGNLTIKEPYLMECCIPGYFTIRRGAATSVSVEVDMRSMTLKQRPRCVDITVTIADLWRILYFFEAEDAPSMQIFSEVMASERKIVNQGDFASFQSDPPATVFPSFRVR